MKTRRLMAIMMAVLMLLSMIPAAVAVGRPEGIVRPDVHRHLYYIEVGRIPPTCVEPGRVTKACSCGAESTSEIEPTGHNWGEWQIVIQPTDCVSWDGLKESVCLSCGEVAQDEVNGDHTWESETTRRATCTEEGSKRSYCSVCGAEGSRSSISALGHSWSAWEFVSEATCVQQGERRRTCSRCGAHDSGYAYAEHQWGPWVVIQEPDPYGQIGIRERKCSVCGLTEREEFYPDGMIFKGDRGDNVEALQEDLNEQGHDCGTADGIFGNKTENGIKSWQEANGYTPDGLGWPGQVEEILGNGDNGDRQYITSFTMVFTQAHPEILDGVSLGEVIDLPMRLVNTGETYFDVSDRYIQNGDGDWAVQSEYPDWYDGSHVAPGDIVEDNYHLTITERDIELGEVVRTYTQVVYAKVYEGTDVFYGIEPQPEGHSGLTQNCIPERYEVTVQIVIPLIPDNSGEANGDAVLEKCQYNLPANGEYYVVGETIEYILYFHNLRNHELHDVEIVDPLKGSNEDSVLTIEPCVDPLAQLQVRFSYTVTEEDAAVGSVTNTATAMWWNPEINEQLTCESNTLVLPVGYAEEDPIVLTKSVVSTPANGAFYVPGETILFEIAIENTSAETLYDVILYDPILDFAELKPYDVMEPGFTDVVGFSYVVTEEDTEVGYVENTAFVFRPNGEGAQDRIWSNTVTVPCVKKVFVVEFTYVVTAYTEVVKSVISTPANGQFYLPGETVTFQIDVTNTHPNMAMLDVAVIDPLMYEYGGAWECMSIDPGATESVTFDYVVTQIDAIAGSITNIASAEGYIATGDPSNPKGPKCVGVSNTVVVPTGAVYDAPFGVITDVDIVKEETSTPANGSYYTEGETITYKITYTNIGETVLEEVIIYDTLANGGDIASAEMLDVGEERYCTFNYVVTAEDVAAGYVVNAAIAQFNYNGYFNSVTSEPVVSDTDGDPNTTYVPGFGTIKWEELRGTGTDENGNALPEVDTCYIKPVVRDGVVVEYEVRFCTEHAAIYNDILSMAQSTNGANMHRAWEYAYGMWQTAIDAMYEEILAVCDEDAKIIVMGERVTNLAMIANTQYALKIVNPGMPAETARVIAELWQYKCIDLCHLMNTAPGARADSIFSIDRNNSVEAAGENCTCVVVEETENGILFADHYCAVHSSVYETTEILLMADNSEETWATVRSLWEIELNSVYNALYAGASEEGGIAYLVEYASYLNWLAAQEAFLNAAYPQNPEIVDEVMVNIIMERVQDGCERMM